jgi:pantoate--beta-alanine ligase
MVCKGTEINDNIKPGFISNCFNFPKMILFKTAVGVEQKLRAFKNENKSIGFVPTLGALHNGHISLIEASKKQNDITVCSIFVNPTQFNDADDFKKYPVTIEKDILLLEENETDILFLPSVKEIYPSGTDNLLHYDLGFIETILEGKYRPGHFQGVCEVVHRLLSIIQPDNLFLGQKDYQQCMVLKKMIDSLELKTKLVISPTLRETSGLAMSSRNMRLNEDDKIKAITVYQSLLFIKKNIHTKNIETLKAEAAEMLLQNGFEKVDYVEIADAETLSPISHWSEKTKIVALIAAFIGGVRLIDNMVIG